MDFSVLIDCPLRSLIPSVARPRQLPPGIEADTPSFISRQVESSRLFFFEAADPDPFAVICGGIERCRSDYRIDRQDFPWFALEFVVGGAGTLQLGNLKEELRPGSFFVYGPGIPHRIETDPERPLVKYFVGFAGEEAGRFLQEYDIRPGFASRCLKTDIVRATFDTLIDRGARKSRLARPLCATITRELLLLCRDDAVDAGSTDTQAFASYSRVKEFIEGHFLEVSTLDAVAVACQIDGPYLSRLFARFHGERPYQFLTRLRMEHAATLLLEQGLSVREAAAALGFGDPFHFSRVFKSVHHVPPSRFRQPA